MPELPEVETTKEGIRPLLEGQLISQIIVHNSKLRVPVTQYINELCCGKKILSVTRRAKYIVIQLSQGYLLIHLGMSGHLHRVEKETVLEKHDHITLVLSSHYIVRFHDPRRFGLFLYIDKDPDKHALLAHLGPEPLSDAFDGHYLFNSAKNKNKPIKSLIMDNTVVVGVGNIYAAESLFLSQILPNTPAKNLSQEACMNLASAIKEVLTQAIECGGTTLKDFYAFDGKPGYFTHALKVYGRTNKPCVQCQHPIESIILAGRNSAFCPKCQN